MAEREGKPIVFGDGNLSEDDKNRYREQIRNARRGSVDSLKGGDPVGVVPRPAVPLSQKAVDESDEMSSALTPEGGVRPRPPGSPPISPGTAAMIREASEAAAKQAHDEKEKAVEKAVEEKKEDNDIFNLFDFQGRNEAERVLNNKKRRQAIEARCEPMKLEDLILKNEVQQVVPIVQGQLEVTFRSMTPEENLFIKQYIAKNDAAQNENYLIEKFGICQLVCSLVAVNGKTFVDHRGQDGSPDEKLFEQKLKTLIKMSGYLVADLGINYFWFDIRVRRLLNPESLGNG